MAGRCPEGKHMRMAGYPAKTESLGFTRSGRWLATSGAESIVLWPFFGGGPMGKAPMELGMGEGIVKRLATHPEHEVVAAGFDTGMCDRGRRAEGTHSAGLRTGPRRRHRPGLGPFGRAPGHRHRNRVRGYRGFQPLTERKRKRAAFEKSGAKTFVYAGPVAAKPARPRVIKVFLLLFVHKK